MLTKNQTRALSVLTPKYRQFKNIAKDYSDLRDKDSREQYTSANSSCQGALDSLFKKGLIKYRYKGMYKLI